MTNEERIRSASTEELATMIEIVGDFDAYLSSWCLPDFCKYFGADGNCSAPNDGGKIGDKCIDIVRKWLKSEYQGAE